MIYNNIQCREGLSFPAYLDLPGYSHSFLKSQVQGVPKAFTPTAKMQLGTLVDEIQTGRADMNHHDYPRARKIAAALQSKFGDALSAFKTQVSLSAEVEHGGLVMPVKGRPDYLLPKIMVLDLKVTSGGCTRKSAPTEVKISALHKLADYMGYDNQLWNYGQMSGAGLFFILYYSVPLDECFVLQRHCLGAQAWWEEKVLMFGL